jgi:hypothetical protein
MRGVADSLNVAQTATLLAYAACQGRGEGLGGRDVGSRRDANTQREFTTKDAKGTKNRGTANGRD